MYFFSFGHCVVCSSIYGFWYSLWYLQTLLSGVRVGQSLVISVMFCTLLFVLLYFFSFSHCVVCPSINGFWLPLWYLQTLLNEITRTDTRILHLFVLEKFTRYHKLQEKGLVYDHWVGYVCQSNLQVKTICNIWVSDNYEYVPLIVVTLLFLYHDLLPVGHELVTL